MVRKSSLSTRLSPQVRRQSALFVAQRLLLPGWSFGILLACSPTGSDLGVSHVAFESLPIPAATAPAIPGPAKVDTAPIHPPAQPPPIPGTFLPRANRPGIPDDATQAIVVTTPRWKDYRGQLHRFERVDGASPWVPSTAHPVAISLGRYGMGWGRGLHEDQEDGPTKFEGDHRSPAGVFDLGEARGYAAQPPEGTSWPFQHSGIRSRCMDDPRSDAYNTFISTQGMPLPPSVGIARRDTVFEFMLFVMHNTSPVLRGAGSCVFLHVWAKPDQPTQGCVAMSRESLADLLPWLDLDRRPVLVQLPASVHRKFQADWSLPQIE